MNRQKGFTFVELLVVITIIAILATAVTSAYSTIQKRSRDSRRKSDMTVMKGALEELFTATGAYDTTCSDASGYLQGSWPTDPRTGVAYTSSYCDADSFYLCADMEINGTGNATTKATNANGASLAWGAGNYYCVANSQ